jgi:hypothetical protein
MLADNIVCLSLKGQNLPEFWVPDKQGGLWPIGGAFFYCYAAPTMGPLLAASTTAGAGGENFRQ